MKKLAVTFLALVSLSAFADPYLYTRGTCVQTEQTALGALKLVPTNDTFVQCRGVGWWLTTPYEIENIQSATTPPLSEEEVDLLLRTIATLLLAGFILRLLRRVLNL